MSGLQSGIMIQLFLVGLLSTSGPCLISCAPVVLPCIAATRSSFWQGVRDTGLFLVGRLLCYLLLGALSVSLVCKLDSPALRVMLGGLILVCGICLVADLSRTGHGWCRLVRKATLDKPWGLFVMGILIGLAPCLPLLAVLASIADATNAIWVGVVYSLCFGIGTGIPLLLLGGLSGLLGNISSLAANRNLAHWFRRACGALLIFVGASRLLSCALAG